MYPYYILKVELFDESKTEYPPIQPTIEGSLDRPPATVFKKEDDQTQLIKDFIKYELTTEVEKEGLGRAYFSEEIFDRWIEIKQCRFYFNKNNNIIILSSPRRIFQSFYKSFINDIYFKFQEVSVNFDRIINNQNSLGVKGVWLGKLPDTNLHSLHLIGSKVDNSKNYQDFLRAGAEIKNITIIYDYFGEQVPIMITRDGGILLYTKEEETDVLPMILDVYTKTIKQ